MGISVFPVASAGGGIKSVQRGQAVSSGNIVITSVDTAKTFVRSISEGASGTVATNSTAASGSGTIDASSSTFSLLGMPDGVNRPPGASTVTATSGSSGLAWTVSTTITNPSKAVTTGTQALSGGTMDATTKQFGVYLSNSTTLVATGACRWEVVEFA